MTADPAPFRSFVNDRRPGPVQELDRLQLVNPNWQGLPGASGHQPAKVVIVSEQGGDANGAAGVTDCGYAFPPGVPRVPNICNRIFIYSNALKAVVGDDATMMLALRRAVVAHEAGHTVNLYHNEKAGCMMYAGALQSTGVIPTEFCKAIPDTNVVCDTCTPFKKIPVSNFDETSTLRVRP